MGLAIGKAKLMSKKIAVSFSKCFLRKKVISLLKYWTTDDGFLVFFYLG